MNKEKIIKFISELEALEIYGVNRSLVSLKKEVGLYFDCERQKRSLGVEVEKQLRVKDRVQVGGGRHYLDGFINIDLSEPADIVCDVRLGIPLSDESVKLVFSEHFLEHIDFPKSVNTFFSESWRILKKGGKLVVGVPDAGLVINGYCNNNEILEVIKNNWYLNRKIYGEIDSDIDIVNLVIRDEDADEKYNPHYWGYDERKLVQLFKKNNFSKIKKWTFDAHVANPKRKLGSLYVEGIKR